MVLEIALPGGGGAITYKNECRGHRSIPAAGLGKRSWQQHWPTSYLHSDDWRRKLQAGDQTIYLSFVKKPTRLNLILPSDAPSIPVDDVVLLAAVTPFVDGEDFSWLWDVEAEAVRRISLDVV